VVVGDYVGVVGVLQNILDASDPGFEFVERIEVVVALVGRELGIVAN
jgi:hypothetical protein